MRLHNHGIARTPPPRAGPRRSSRRLVCRKDARFAKGVGGVEARCPADSRIWAAFASGSLGLWETCCTRTRDGIRHGH
eukprot:5790698-Prymnesium_polylepis.1